MYLMLAIFTFNLAARNRSSANLRHVLKSSRLAWPRNKVIPVGKSYLPMFNGQGDNAHPNLVDVPHSIVKLENRGVR